ncbi:type VII secretion protein EccB [Streptomyces jeddahensis]|uniref:ESX-1 secretion system protein eccB1 n=1 Tax=Streptomyces jeddahensis TaxID=1716141 RepID=A0A177HJE0_9ACTN|nr:type VII secretion protein EccB [Streptomyces jeddahensis]OAH10710.1 ESX-1 secretion system protein eccB1 [Streptomyces jeddahensis]
MAKRRDELAAYTFARKRTVAAFLAPSPGGSEEGAPRPIRTVMPSLAVGVVLVVGFIAWGVIKPAAPVGWDTPGEYIIVDSDSTTRYVVLEDEGANGKKTKTLHPVLNYASAKLLLDKGKGTVKEVPGKEIDKSGIPHGATLGIPYAPDRLPSKEDAEKAKTWAVCERPTPGSDNAVDRAVFVLDADDAKSLGNAGKVGADEALYVVDTSTQRKYLVDGKGKLFLLGGRSGVDSTAQVQLLAAVFGTSSAEPQPVSREWLRTFNGAGAITFPTVPNIGRPTTVQGLPPEAQTVGRVLKAQEAQGEQYYVVLEDRVAPITPFVAALLKSSPAAQQVFGPDDLDPVDVNTSAIIAANGGQADGFYADKGWPQSVPRQANPAATATEDARTTSCSVYDGTIGENDKPHLAAWAGKAYPKKVIADSLGAYVSSGSGLLFQEVTGTAKGGGRTYLLTDTGLRYSLPANNDSTAEETGSGSASSSSESEPSETDKARTRLGYEELSNLAIVPQSWATFIPKGPTLDTGSAAQPQSQ